MNCKELTEESFDSFPVWTWDDENEGHIPIKNFDPLPEDVPTLFIKACFETPKGRKFRGYLIGSDTFYAFGLFVKGQEYVFNLNLPDMIESTLGDIFHLLDDNPFDLFPLKYETSVHFNGKSDLSGIISL